MLKIGEHYIDPSKVNFIGPAGAYGMRYAFYISIDGDGTIITAESDEELEELRQKIIEATRPHYESLAIVNAEAIQKVVDATRLRLKEDEGIPTPEEAASDKEKVLEEAWKRAKPFKPVDEQINDGIKE